MKRIVGDMVAELLVALVVLVLGFAAGGHVMNKWVSADLAAQGYTLQRVEVVGEGARWMVVER